MTSKNDESNQPQAFQASHFQKTQPVDYNLTAEQYMIIQHYLPKRYALIEHKNMKKATGGGSAMKLGEEVSSRNIEAQNVSRLSGLDKSEEIDGRIKRIRIKKVDKYLDEDLPKPVKKISISQQIQPEDELAHCSYIITQLKKHKSSYPFLIAVEPKRDGVLNYFDIIKEPMDLSTVEENLNNKVYSAPSQFHSDVNKIWQNSYTFNDKATHIHKLTVEMERYYKNLLNNEGLMKKSSMKDKSKIKVEKEKEKMISKGEMIDERAEIRKKSESVNSREQLMDDNF